MKRKTVLIAAVFCIFSMLTACGETRIAGSESPHVDAGSSGESNEPAVRQIIFHNTIDDPQADYMNSLGGGGSKTTGTANLDLVLCETEPNVFEGCGIMNRNLDILAEEANSRQDYVYRTGLIRAELGKQECLTLTGWVIEDRDTETMLSDAPFRLQIHKDGTLQQKELPVLLTLAGNQATLSIKMHEHAELVFSGGLSSKTAEVPKNESLDMDGLIYINSLWSCSFSGNDEDTEYTAVLVVSPVNEQNNYSGQLSIHENGNEFEIIDEAVIFAFEPFNAVTYQNAGGQMRDVFEYMSILHVAERTVILMLDKEQAILELAGEGICFFGSIRSQLEFAVLQNEADQTRTMLNHLYSENNGAESEMPDYSELMNLDPNNPEDMQRLIEMAETLDNSMDSSDAPAWYPQGLIPMIHFSEYDGFITVPTEKGLFFRIYCTHYAEEEDIEVLVEPYRTVLSGYDAYNEFIDYENSEAVFVFTMGRYTVQVLFTQSVIKMTDVSVQIF